MSNNREKAPAAIVNQKIPFDLKLDIESLVTRVSKIRKQRVNQKDLIIEILEKGIEVIEKKLK